MCRGVSIIDVRASVRLMLLCWCHAHLDADPDLDASTNRAFRDVRDVGPNIFGRSVRSDASSYGYSAW